MFLPRKRKGYEEGLIKECQAVAYGVKNKMSSGSHTHVIPSHIHSIHHGVNPNDISIPQKVVSEEKAKEFTETIDKKIASLIDTRSISQSKQERQSLTISIMTLEMVRDLARQVFLCG